MPYSQPVTELIKRRYSCRTYLPTPIEEGKRQQLEAFMSSNQTGPFGAPVRFLLLAATAEDRGALRGLGTYGFIQGATGFIVGMVRDGPRNLEDFGYCMERIVLYATDLGLSTFAVRAGLREGEQMPAVAAVGHIAIKRSWMDRIIRGGAGAEHRYPSPQLFFRERFGQPVSFEDAGPYAPALEMVRQAPSASNKQPWRIIQDGSAWHFYVQRTPGYRSARLVQLPDMQRVDLGIAMCHWELTAGELGLPGHWLVQKPAIAEPDSTAEYTATWLAER
jgi:hypothetical protein